MGAQFALTVHQSLFHGASWRYKQSFMHYCACPLVCIKVHVLGFLKS